MPTLSSKNTVVGKTSVRYRVTPAKISTGPNSPIDRAQASVKAARTPRRASGSVIRRKAIARVQPRLRAICSVRGDNCSKVSRMVRVANAAKLKAVHAAIVWNVVAQGYPNLVTLELPELQGCIATVRIAVLNQSRRPADAEAFVRYAADPLRGGMHFRAAGLK